MADIVHPVARRGSNPRGAYQAVSGSQSSYRGPQPRASPRMSLQHGSLQMASLTRQPGVLPPQRSPQVARRARGRGATGPRGYY